MSSADRMRRSRQRRQAGTVLVKLYVPKEVVETLVSQGWLRAAGTEDEVRQAVLNLLSSAIDSKR
jgi:hypothetical protein